MRCRDEHGRKDAFLQAQCDILETCVSFSFHLLYCGRLGRLPLKYREIDEGKKRPPTFFSTDHRSDAWLYGWMGRRQTRRRNESSETPKWNGLIRDA